MSSNTWKPVIQLSNDEIRTGMMMSDRWRKAAAEMHLCAELEQEYVALLRKKHGLSSNWSVIDWLVGLEQLAGQPDQTEE